MAHQWVQAWSAAGTTCSRTAHCRRTWWTGCAETHDEQDALKHMMDRMRWNTWWTGCAETHDGQDALKHMLDRMRWNTWWTGCAETHDGQDVLKHMRWNEKRVVTLHMRTVLNGQIWGLIKQVRLRLPLRSSLTVYKKNGDYDCHYDYNVADNDYDHDHSHSITITINHHYYNRLVTKSILLVWLLIYCQWNLQLGNSVGRGTRVLNKNS